MPGIPARCFHSAGLARPEARSPRQIKFPGFEGTVLGDFVHSRSPPHAGLFDKSANPVAVAVPRKPEKLVTDEGPSAGRENARGSKNITDCFLCSQENSRTAPAVSNGNELPFLSVGKLRAIGTRTRDKFFEIGDGELCLGSPLSEGNDRLRSWIYWIAECVEMLSTFQPLECRRRSRRLFILDTSNRRRNFSYFLHLSLLKLKGRIKCDRKYEKFH